MWTVRAFLLFSMYYLVSVLAKNEADDNSAKTYKTDSRYYFENAYNDNEALNALIEELEILHRTNGKPESIKKYESLRGNSSIKVKPTEEKIQFIDGNTPSIEYLIAKLEAEDRRRRIAHNMYVKKNIDPIDRSGFSGFNKKNIDPIDRSGFSTFVKKNFDTIDSSGFSTFTKKNFDPIDRSGFNTFLKRNFDPIDASGFNNFMKKNFDQIDRSGFSGFSKKNLDPIDRSGFSGFTKKLAKKNFDPIDRSGFGNFVKKNFDPIDRSGFDSFFKKRSSSEEGNNK